MLKELKAKVFISCGQREDELSFAQKISERLKEKGFDPYVAVQQQTLKGLKENIFEELASSEYFLFVDLKRELIEKDVYRGSLFCHQELAIASFLEIPLVGFQERGIKPDEGILKFIQANCTGFTDRGTLIEKIVKKIDKAGWKSNWKNQLKIERKSDQFIDIKMRKLKKMCRFFHITVHNHNPHKHAKNCYAFLETVRDLSTGNSLPVKSVEFKWAGYVLPNAAILPSSSRDLDGFFVFHDDPNTPNFNVFTDSSYFIPRLKGPGDYELTYLVVSDNFEQVRSTFKMNLGNKLIDIRFEQVEEPEK